MSYPGPGRWRGSKARGSGGTPGVPTQLVWTTQPAGAVDGIAFTQQPVVTIADYLGNAVTGATNTITLSITSGTGTLGGTVAVAAVSGVVTYTDIKITGVGTDQLTATGASLTSPQSNTIVVTGLGDKLLLETGSHILLESGSFLLMEV